MVRSKPEPKPFPSEGGSYLLDEGTGEWVKEDEGLTAPSTAAEPAPEPQNDHGPLPEAPAAGGD